MRRLSRQPLGQILLSQGLLNEDQIALASKKRAENGHLFGQVLLQLGLIKEERCITAALALQRQLSTAQLKAITISSEILQLIPARLAVYYQALPIERNNDTLVIACARPWDIETIDSLRREVRSPIKFVLAGEQELQEAIKRYYGIGADTVQQLIVNENPQGFSGEPVAVVPALDSEASVGKFIQQLLAEAVKRRATDIHFEPFERDLKIRYRVDGTLYDAQVPANIGQFQEAINSRIKIMANLNIAEKRLPQDGRFPANVDGQKLDLRVSFLPVHNAESVVIRLLNARNVLSMKDLGLTSIHRQHLQNLLEKQHGIIFVTGPTGSGKTTTLYSCLSLLNKSDKKIITIEDPIEYRLRGITQIQINPAIKLTFAAGLRSMLRHDPDVMMVGEVRDRETAEVAIQIALTGHLIFSTLHTNDAASGVARLLDMGIEPFLITSSVECFIAQRLLRLLCPHCKRSTGPTSFRTFEPQGCELCQHTGYYGRTGIYEFLPIDDMIRKMILERAGASEIQAQAVKQGMRTLLQSGEDLVRQGLTSSVEVLRVIQNGE